jgi:hypothetical protein
MAYARRALRARAAAREEDGGAYQGHSRAGQASNAMVPAGGLYVHVCHIEWHHNTPHTLLQQ